MAKKQLLQFLVVFALAGVGATLGDRPAWAAEEGDAYEEAGDGAGCGVCANSCLFMGSLCNRICDTYGPGSTCTWGGPDSCTGVSGKKYDNRISCQ